MRTVKLMMAAAIASAVAFPAISVIATSAEAKTYTKRKHINRDKCYRAKRVPALVEYNTRGRLVRGPSRSWRGNAQRHGSLVVDKYHDPVYIQTSRIVEDQHVTLVPTGCR